MKWHKLMKSPLALFAIAAMAACQSEPQNFEPQYIGGYPTEETAKAAFDEYDYQAACQFYVWGYAYLNSLGFEKGLKRLGGGNERSFYIFDRRIQPNQGVITPNDEVVYVWSRIIDLSRGPVVFEVPPRVRGHFWDLGMRAYEDVGDVGPDGGKGGQYVAMSADYDGPVPAGHFPVRVAHSDWVSFVFRAFPATEGSLKAAVDHAQTARWHYLEEASAPPVNSMVLIGDRDFSQEWPRDTRAFEWLAEVFTMDRVPASGLAHMGNMRRLGFTKGQPFQPDARARRILERAAKTAEAMVLSMAFRNRWGVSVYDDRQFDPPIFNRNSRFYQEHYEEVEERAGSWHQLVGNFASFTPAKPGTGQFAMIVYRDANGDPLIGSNTYRLRVPPDVPVAQFWQIPVYEVATRAMINAPQQRTSLSSTDDLVLNDDGSVDLYFAPKLPDGAPEKNWVQTIPGEGWFSVPRLYAPLEPILDKTWRWNDFEKVK